MPTLYRTMHTADDVAAWVEEVLRRDGGLAHAHAVEEITERFGMSFLYENRRGRLATRPDVLKRLRARTEGDVVWYSQSKGWILLPEGETFESRTFPR